MSAAISLENVTKAFGPKVAVQDLDMVVPDGSMVGYIGPNGAGKTTTIRMIMSILFPDAGEIRVLGRASALEAKDRIGYLPEQRGVYKNMKVGAFLRYMARLKGHTGPEVNQRVVQWLEKVGLGETINKKCEELSKGMQQKVQFIAAVLHEPDLLILDEPFSGLDPVNMRLLRDLIEQEHKRGATVIFSTHVMIQAEELCDHILMLNNGQKVLDESRDSIRGRFDPRVFEIEPLQKDLDVGTFQQMDSIEHASVESGEFTLRVRDGFDVPQVMAQVAANTPVARIELQRPSLEDLFVEIVAGSSNASEESLRELRTSLRDEGDEVTA